ncbi:MAG: alpha-amylase family glycosyl hydrolase [Saprospiraceae bacterium]
MKKYCLPLLLALLFAACDSTTETNKKNAVTAMEKYEPVALGVLPDWAKNANIYEVNLRQYTEEGNIAAFRKQLPRLKKMGVDILWFMPIFPIGELKRKGTLGSYYSVKDFKALNPYHGTIEEFKSMVKEIHAMDMKIILDWVPNHSSWDNAWITEHPEWYTHDNDTITHPLDPNTGSPTGWTDVADFNYDNPEMRAAMIDALTYWVKDIDVDGYRCDVAGFVPNDFWKQAITALNQEKHVFMLAEWDNEPAHFENGFHMNYSWEFKEVIKEIAHGKQNAKDVWAFYEKQEKKFPEQAIHMYFITNHDENSWNNYPAVLGDAENALAVLAFTFDGMPLIYSGQESGLPDTISFFNKDLFEWGDYKNTNFYSQLLALKHQNAALANGIYGGKMQSIETVTNGNVFAFTRSKGENQVAVFINLSKDKQETPIAKEIAQMETVMEEGSQLGETLTLAPWGYLIKKT